MAKERTGLKALIGQRLNAVSADIEKQEITFHGDYSEAHLKLSLIPKNLFWGLLVASIGALGSVLTSKKLSYDPFGGE